MIRGYIETRQVLIDGKPLAPDHSLSLRSHSPDGFNWGYAGSGPAQLALAILLTFVPKEIALKYYQDFKFQHVALWKQSFSIKKNEVRRWLEAKLGADNCLIFSEEYDLVCDKHLRPKNPIIGTEPQMYECLDCEDGNPEYDERCDKCHEGLRIGQLRYRKLSGRSICMKHPELHVNELPVSLNERNEK